MPAFNKITFEMTELQGAGKICPPHMGVLSKDRMWNRVRRHTLNFF